MKPNKGLFIVAMLAVTGALLLTACHSTVPLDDPVDISGTVTSQAQSTEPLTETPTLPPETGHIGSETLPDDIPDINPAPVSTVDSDFTTARADTSNTVITHTPRTDFFIGTAPEDGMKTQVIEPSNVLQNENFVFYKGIYEMMKRNLKTLEETPVCCDPFCTHWETIFITGSPEDACPFNDVSGVLFLYKNKIYYIRTYAKELNTDGAAEWHDVFSSYDYMTGEYRAIEDLKILYNTNTSQWVSPDRDMFQYFGSFCVYGSYAYSFQYRPIHGKGDSAQDYGRVLVRLDLETDKSTDLMLVEDILPKNAVILAIRNRIIYLMTTDALWVWNPAEGTMRRITVIDPAYTTWYRKGNCAIYDGFLYTMTYHYPDGYAIDKLQHTEIPLTCLLRINLETGEPEQLTDVCPEYVFFHDENIYIVPQRGYLQKTEYWRLNVNPWKESTIPHKKYMRHILKTDMNGENMETIGYCNSEDIASWGLLLTDTGLLGDLGFFEFSTGITYKSNGKIYDDPNNGYIDETKPSPGIFEGETLPEGWRTLGEETWW